MGLGVEHDPAYGGYHRDLPAQVSPLFCMARIEISGGGENP
jgi:hypothetical protein